MKHLHPASGSAALVLWVWLGALSWTATATAMALQPDQIVVIANQDASGSVKLAQYYMSKRAIPEGRLLKLQVTANEVCSREDYDGHVAPDVREFLQKIDPNGNIRCLVTVYGLPLKVAPPKPTAEERDQMQELRDTQRQIRGQLKGLPKEDDATRKRLQSELDEVLRKIKALSKEDCAAAFDSELALVRAGTYSLPRWIRNPMFIGFRDTKTEVPESSVLMVSRLDGPTGQIVKRVIDDSVAAEESGLTGTAYFDARWPRPREGKKQPSAYGAYDLSIHLAADRVRKSGRMPAVVNEGAQLFGPGDCPDAALYCGWYSLAKYVDAFSWKPGAVGYHVASQECETLRRRNSQVWCKRMLEEGVAATIGPVGEPYLQAFPNPEAFFGLLIEGRLTLVECYALSAPYLSWQMVLIGDPLYRPFRKF